MGLALNTAGVKLGYAVETTKGTKPTKFTHINDIKSVPDFNPEPNALQTTDLSVTGYHTYTEGLRDLGGSLSFGANLTNELITDWGAIVESYKTAKSGGKSMWFEITHPELEKAVFFTGEPSELGLPALEVDSVMETNVYIVPATEPKWDTKIEITEKASA